MHCETMFIDNCSKLMSVAHVLLDYEGKKSTLIVTRRNFYFIGDTKRRIMKPMKTLLKKFSFPSKTMVVSGKENVFNNASTGSDNAM